jgi:hypothetical protein
LRRRDFITGIVGSTITWPLAGHAQSPDHTSRLERLGNPGKTTYPEAEQTFARNVWCLKVFGGRIYIGIGNRDNFGPAPNAGPVDIWYFDPSTSRLVKDWTAPDEQVEIFRVIDGQLVVPGNDPMESWELGNFYRLEQDGWKKYRTLPKGIHNFDMIKFDGVLYAALGTESGAVVAASDDNGMTWRGHPLVPVVRGFYARSHSLFVLSGRLHASATGWMGWRMFVLTRDGFRPMRSSDFFPGIGTRRPVFVHAFTPFREQGVYIARERQAQGHPQPVTLFVAANSHAVRAIELMPDAQPRDIAADAKRLFVLATRRMGDGYDNHVFETGDLVEWREAFRVRTATFARTFEFFGGDFYFGLGTNHDDVHPETGEILRLREQHIAR